MKAVSGVVAISCVKRCQKRNFCTYTSQRPQGLQGCFVPLRCTAGIKVGVYNLEPSVCCTLKPSSNAPDCALDAAGSAITEMDMILLVRLHVRLAVRLSDRRVRGGAHLSCETDEFEVEMRAVDETS